MSHMMENQQPLLAVNRLAVDYVDPPRPAAAALREITFTLAPRRGVGHRRRERLRQVHVMLALMRLLPATGRIVAGSVRLDGAELLDLDTRAMAALRWKRIAMIFQGAMNALNPVRTVGDQIAEAIRLHDGMTDRQSIDHRVDELLDLVGISANRRHQYPFQYSGGMRQRAMIAMALACAPDIIIADEPTTALDVMIQAQILQLLSDLRRQLNLSILLVTHDLGIVAELCDRVLVMYGGVTAETADVDTIYNAPAHPYTQALLQAFPDPTRPAQKLAAIPGAPPRLNDLPPGCRFAPRCPHVFTRCHTAPPPVYTIAPTHAASCFLVELADGGAA
jgi:peptide/nickel transport system ATP-binding protein